MALIARVEAEWGMLHFDLAASEENAKANGYFTAEEDSLSQDWSFLWGVYRLWLNPPFGNIAPWAEKCSIDRRHDQLIFFLVPASIDSNWFWKHVRPKARIYAVSPRVPFDGKNGFPKPIMLCVFGEDPEQPIGRLVWK